MDKINECMQIISFGGEAKSLALQAMKESRERDFEQAEKSIKKSSEALLKSHKAHTNLLSYEAGEFEENQQTSFFMVHAADHLTAASVVNLLAEEIIYLHKERT